MQEELGGTRLISIKDAHIAMATAVFEKDRLEAGCRLASVMRKVLVVPGDPRVSPVLGDITQENHVLIKPNLQQTEPFSNSRTMEISQKILKVEDEAKKVISLGENHRPVVLKRDMDASICPSTQVPTNRAKFWPVQKHMARCSVNIVTQDTKPDKSVSTSIPNMGAVENLVETQIQDLPGIGSIPHKVKAPAHNTQGQ